MKHIRLYNAYLLSSDCATMTFGQLWINDGIITYSGKEKKDTPEFDSEIDCNRNLIIPGFKNAHAHAPMVFLRSYADDLPLDEWLTKQVFPMEAKITPEDSYVFTQLAILEYLQSGITSSFEMYLHPEAMAQAAVDFGFRMVLCGSVNNHVSSVIELEEQYQSFNNFHPLLSMMLGFHAEYTTSQSIIEDIGILAQKLKAPVFTHLSETEKETQECLEKTWKTPTQYLSDLGIWEYGGGGFHGIYLTDKDYEIFRDKKLSLVTNSGSNGKLASGIISLNKAQDYRIPVGIGTDGAASNNALDFFREMYLTTIFQKLKTKSAGALPPRDILTMATRTGGEIMGLQNNFSLEVGQKADLVVLDLNKPNMQPANHIINNIVYSGNPSNVWLTMVHGKVLYQNGEYFLPISPEEIYRKTNEILRRLRS